MKLNKVNIGSEIGNRIKHSNMTKTEFGRKLGIPQQNVNRILEKPSIDTDKLLEICKVLDYNFFALYHEAAQNITLQADHKSALTLTGDAIILDRTPAAKAPHNESDYADLQYKLIKAQEKIIELLEERKKAVE